MAKKPKKDSKKDPKKQKPKTAHDSRISGDNPDASSTPTGGVFGSGPLSDPAQFLDTPGPC